MDVILLITGIGLPSVVVGLRERIEGLEILDVRGHEKRLGRSAGAATGGLGRVLGEWRLCVEESVGRGG